MLVINLERVMRHHLTNLSADNSIDSINQPLTQPTQRTKPLSEATFTLHPQLEKDSVWITDLDLCNVRLINDNNYPWIILVPRRDNATEIYRLSREDQNQLSIESEAVCKTMVSIFTPDKMNVATIGNIVPQLHIHHIARFDNDVAWPDPVWGYTQAIAYEEQTLEQEVKVIKDRLMKLIAPQAAPTSTPTEKTPSPELEAN